MEEIFSPTGAKTLQKKIDDDFPENSISSRTTITLPWHEEFLKFCWPPGVNVAFKSVVLD